MILSSASDVLIHGPRGNGKTVLLNWLYEMIKREHSIGQLTKPQNKPVRVVKTDPTEIADMSSLMDTLGLLSELNSITYKLELGATSVAKGSRSTTSTPRPPSLFQALVASCKEMPLVLLIDEAHTLDPTVGRSLHNASQRVRDEAPFCLVLAGTPDLHAHLSEMSATFVDRAAELDIGIGRLDVASSTQALLQPLVDCEMSFTKQSLLDKVVTNTHYYPYFIQMWGSALWHTAHDAGSVQIDDAIYEASVKRFVKPQTNYYRHRYEEIKNSDYVDVALAVANMFQEDVTLPDWRVDDVIRSATTDTKRARLFLRHTGFIWQPSGSSEWEPGMPSLMNHVLKMAPQPRDTDDTDTGGMRLS